MVGLLAACTPYTYPHTFVLMSLPAQQHVLQRLPWASFLQLRSIGRAWKEAADDGRLPTLGKRVRLSTQASEARTQARLTHPLAHRHLTRLELVHDAVGAAYAMAHCIVRLVQPEAASRCATLEALSVSLKHPIDLLPLLARCRALGTLEIVDGAEIPLDAWAPVVTALGVHTLLLRDTTLPLCDPAAGLAMLLANLRRFEYRQSTWDAWDWEAYCNLLPELGHATSLEHLVLETLPLRPGPIVALCSLHRLRSLELLGLEWGTLLVGALVKVLQSLGPTSPSCA
jgi:hypothetical protein